MKANPRKKPAKQYVTEDDEGNVNGDQLYYKGENFGQEWRKTVRIGVKGRSLMSCRGLINGDNDDNDVNP